MTPTRHDLLRLHPAGWHTLLTRRPDLPLKGWAEADHPAIARRAQPGDPSGFWPAAITLPGRIRLAFAVHPDEVAGIERPPLLRDAVASAPAEWRDTARLLADVGDRLGIRPRLFGSLMWQHVTAQPYLAPASDLDLLWTVPEAVRPQLPRLFAALTDAPAPPRLDGEIVFPGLGAAQWRELAAARPHDEVLLKTATGVTLTKRERLLPAHA
jgi:phosphoribosyl-dephospho-CoA transferase